MAWPKRSGKTSEAEAAGKELEVLIQREPQRDNGGHEERKEDMSMEERHMEDTTKVTLERRNQLPVKLELKSRGTSKSSIVQQSTRSGSKFEADNVQRSGNEGYKGE